MDSVEHVVRTGPQLLADAYARRDQDLAWLVRHLTRRLRAHGTAIATVLPLEPDSPVCRRCGRRDSWVLWAGTALPRCLCAGAAPCPTPDRQRLERCARACRHRHVATARRLITTQAHLTATFARLDRSQDLLATTRAYLEAAAPRG